MALKFNTFRTSRYLRSKFVEGKFLLASEATDLELEIMDLLRKQVQRILGDVAIEDAWKVEKLNDTQILIKPGIAWFKGLPFEMRDGKDQLVSGVTMALGTKVPDGVTVTDDASGLGKILTFGTISNPNTAAPSGKQVTPSNTYRFIVTAKEELITDLEDQFLQNANLTESTAQKIRINFQINIVPDSIQTESPIPYRDENSIAIDSSLTPTNFPNLTGDAQPNFINQIVVTPSTGVGDVFSTNIITGQEKITGKDLELIINSPNGTNPLPKNSTTQAAFSHGTLIDSNGTKYHINLITPSAIDSNNKMRVDIDLEYNQELPVIDIGRPYTLVKRDIYVTDDLKGLPSGKIHWPFAKLTWNNSNGITHQSDLTDLRNKVQTEVNLQDRLPNRLDMFLVAGGNISWDATTALLNWSAILKLVNPYSPLQTIAATSAPLVDGGSLVYEMNLDTGGVLGRGTLAIASTSTGTTLTLTGSPDLSTVRIGNIIVDDNGTVGAITNIDNVNDTLTVDTSMTFTSTGTIYLDSYAAETAPKALTNFVLAVRDGSKVYVGINDLELESGETSQLGDGISLENLTYIGATDETDSDPNYSSINIVTQGGSLTQAVGELDAGLNTTNTELGNLRTYTGADNGIDTTPDYSSDIRGVANESLEARAGTLTDISGDYQEDRSAYLKSVDNIVWTGSQIEFTTDIVLEVLNTKSGTLTTHTISTGDSPVIIANGESLYINIDRTTNETISLINSGTTPIPAQTQANKDIFILFKRIDESGASNLYMPFSKQFAREGKVFKLGAAGEGGGLGIKATFLDPVSSTLPTGSSVTLDGIAGVDGDTVLFTNLSSGNNRVYELAGVGSSITWTVQRAFDGQFDPTDGDTVRVLKGNSFREQLAIFDSVDFLVNDVVRYFDGVSGDFWELSSIKTTTINNNTTGNIFSVSVTGSENIIVSYSVVRGSAKETGEILITSDGTSAAIARTNAYLSDIGVNFSASINTGNLELNYTSDNTTSGTMKYFVKRWSNASGGPTGIPSYTGATGGSTAAAGSIGEIQFHGSGGNLDADSRLAWDGTEGALSLNGLKYTSLSSAITLNDNQISPLAIINYSNTSFNYAIVEYSAVRNGEYRTGRFLISNDNTTKAGFSDDFVETNPLGITFSVSNSASIVNVNYTSTSTGFTGTFKYTIRKWA